MTWYWPYGGKEIGMLRQFKAATCPQRYSERAVKTGTEGGVRQHLGDLIGMRKIWLTLFIL